ncbi:MAG TPA: hypothetical protein VIY90_05375 [Steroidobacteraceae bacterium]
MKHWIKPMAAAIALGGCALTAQQAQAGCNAAPPQRLTPAVYRHEEAGGLLKIDFKEGGPFNTTSVTGLYEYEWWAPIGPGGANILFDSGFQTIHDDGTELGNSGSRAPVTGSFCTGIWTQTGPFTYEINHWGLSWVTDGPPTGFATLNGTPDNPDSAFVFAGPANILQKLVLARDGNSYTGTFTLTQYLPNAGGPAFDTSAGPAGPAIVGTIKACRVLAGKEQPYCPFWKVTQ